MGLDSVPKTETEKEIDGNDAIIQGEGDVDVEFFCAPGCRWEQLGVEVCDRACMNRACHFDWGDC